MADQDYRPLRFGGRVNSWICLVRRLREGNAAHDRNHQQPADYSERGHEIKIAAPTFVEQQPEKISRQTSAEILEGIDQARGEPGHLRTADIHRLGGAEDRVRRVGGERNQNEENDRGIGRAELRGKKNDRRLEKIKTRCDGRATSVEHFVRHVTGNERARGSDERNQEPEKLKLGG